MLHGAFKTSAEDSEGGGGASEQLQTLIRIALHALTILRALVTPAHPTPPPFGVSYS